VKIFFTGSPRSLRIKEQSDNLNKIYKSLSAYGKHTSDLVINNDPDSFYEYSLEEIDQHYQNTLTNLKKAYVIVVEVSIHSLSMGYLINKGIELSKPTLCLYSKGNAPFFLSGIHDPNLVVSEYTYESIDDVISDAFDYFSGNQDKRFNLMLSPQMINFLNDYSKKNKMSKAQIIRKAINELMKVELNK